MPHLYLIWFETFVEIQMNVDGGNSHRWSSLIDLMTYLVYYSWIISKVLIFNARFVSMIPSIPGGRLFQRNYLMVKYTLFLQLNMVLFRILHHYLNITSIIQLLIILRIFVMFCSNSTVFCLWCLSFWFFNFFT